MGSGEKKSPTSVNTTTMRASSVLNFQSTLTALLRRPWQTFKDGQIWYGIMKTGTKRLPLTTKQGNKNYYKGTGSSGNGKLNKSGIYVMNWEKVRTFVVPSDLNQGGDLKALVSPRVPQLQQRFIGYQDGAKSPQFALDSIINFIEHGENYSDIDLEKSQYLEEFISTKAKDAQFVNNEELIEIEK